MLFMILIKWLRILIEQFADCRMKGDQSSFGCWCDDNGDQSFSVDYGGSFKTALTLSKEFYDLFNQIIVIDHHRRDQDFPENAVITYIESGASSACELVTELIQFQNSKTKRLSKMQASVLMAGIMLDTKKFSSRVTSRTFDVASYLRTRGKW